MLPPFGCHLTLHFLWYWSHSYRSAPVPSIDSLLLILFSIGKVIRCLFKGSNRWCSFQTALHLHTLEIFPTTHPGTLEMISKQERSLPQRGFSRLPGPLSHPGTKCKMISKLHRNTKIDFFKIFYSTPCEFSFSLQAHFFWLGMA